LPTYDLETVATAIEAGEAALVSGRWKEARRQFTSALEREETAEALEGLGHAAWRLDDGPAVFDSRERAYRLYRRLGDSVSAGRVATQLAWDYTTFRAEPAVANGWLGRAHRLLDGAEPCVEQGWLALRDASQALQREPERAQDLTQSAMELARSLSDSDLEVVALALDGLVRVSRGDIERGMTQLDEASAAAVGGDVQGLDAIGLSCCYLIFACERIQDFDRAAQWCEQLSRFADDSGIRPLFAVCRTHYANVLTVRGLWQEAEAELVPAAENFLATRPAQAVDAHVRLGELRRRQGRLDEADELFTRSEPHPLAYLGHGAVALDRGDAGAAADGAERFLRVYKGDPRVEHAAGLELTVKANVRLGRIERAEQGAAQLEALADAVGSATLLGAASLAKGLVEVAGGDHEAGRRSFESAVDHFVAGGLPFEESYARLELARALDADGKREVALLEAQRALRQLRDLGSGAREAEALVNELGGRRRGDGSLTSRELDVLRLVGEGLSDGEIAERLVLSEHTVHRHIANVRTKLGVSSRAAAAAKATRDGLL
jgi:LuxR family transcriptional regulator, maltose regulon positive regulatory protein